MYRGIAILKYRFGVFNWNIRFNVPGTPKSCLKTYLFMYVVVVVWIGESYWTDFVKYVKKNLYFRPKPINERLFLKISKIHPRFCQ